MATNDIGRVTPIWRGFYSAGATYELNDIVIDASGSIWWHKSHEVTTGVTPAAGAIWAAVIDMSVFSGLIQAAITTAQTALAAAQAALAEVTADTERAETAADNAENSAAAASESAAGVGALAQAAERSAEAAAGSATGAAGSAQAAAGSKSDAEAYAVGTRGGEDVGSTDPTYHNNAKYYAEQAGSSAEAAAQSAEDAQDVLDSIPEDYSRMSADVSDLKTQFEDVIGSPAETITSLENYELYQGFITKDNIWGYITPAGDSSRYTIVPIEIPGGAFSIKAQADHTAYYAFLSGYSTPTQNGEIPSFCSSPYDTRKSISGADGGKSATGTVPDDAKYLYIGITTNTGVDIAPSAFSLTIPGVPGTVTQKVNENSDNIDMLKPRTDTLETKVADLGNDASAFERNNLDGLAVYTGNITSEGTWNNLTGDNYQYVLVPAIGGMIVTATPIDGSTGIRLSVLRDYVEPTSGADVLFSQNSAWNSPPVWTYTTFSAVLPEDTKYVLVVTKYGSEGIDHTPSSFSLEKGMNTPVNWLAMGDSITFGYYSTPTTGEDGESHTDKKTYGWAYQVANINKWMLNNIAIGGTGFLDKASDNTQGYYIARNTDFTPYDLVTIAYGINDWKANKPLGVVDEQVEPGQQKDKDKDNPVTVLGAMEATIEAIMASNPACKIIVMLPLNIRGYSNARLSKSTKYARESTAYPNMGTLDSFADKMIEVCHLYGIQYIDQTRYSVLNTENMVDLLPDGVHPSVEAHRLIARELAKKITF